MKLPEIGTLWIGKELSWLEQLCLQSFLDNGHEVTLFVREPVIGVPDGVRQQPAAEILSDKNVVRHARTGSPAYYADKFRLHLLAKTDMIWADTDAYCCQPWDVPPNSHFHGWISDRKPLVNNGVLSLPSGSSTLLRMLEFTGDEYPVPPWFNSEEQETLRQDIQNGCGKHVSLMPWGVWGPNALTYFLKDTGEIDHSRPGHVLYPLPFSQAGYPLRKGQTAQFEEILKEDTLSIHFWGRRIRNVAAKFGGIPQNGSFMSNLLEKHRIDPAASAHLFPTAQVPGARFNARDVDFSVFDDRDVANLVLQRSDVAPDAVREIKDWLEGNDDGLLQYAHGNRDRILLNVFDHVQRDCAVFLDSLDGWQPGRCADIGCGYAFADLVIYRETGCSLALIDIEESGPRHFNFETTGAGYSNLSKAKAFLESNGVPSSKITTTNPNLADVTKVGNVDLAISMLSCGFHYPVATYEKLFSGSVEPGGSIVLDIRKGSGGIPKMKEFGELSILANHRKHTTVLVRKGSADV